MERYAFSQCAKAAFEERKRLRAALYGAYDALESNDDGAFLILKEARRGIGGEMSDMVERVAKALAKSTDQSEYWTNYVVQARAAIAALREPTEEEGK
jgi:hypothetical protein